MSTEFLRKIETHDAAMRQMFVDGLRGPQYNDSQLTHDVFHYTLALAESRNWVAARELYARGVGGSESNVRKWFKLDPAKRHSPNQVTMVRALQEVANIMEERLRDEAQTSLEEEGLEGAREIASAAV